MRISLPVGLILMSVTIVQGVELEKIPHKVVGEDRTYIRDSDDKRYNVWTDDTATGNALLKQYGIDVELALKKGEVLAILLNDNIPEDLVQITYNKISSQTFADHADSGMKFRLRRLGENKKFTHLTAVVFAPVVMPNHIGMRGMVGGGLSEKK